MVRSFNPQGRNSSLETNTNFPPQSGPTGGPPLVDFFMLYEDSVIMEVEDGVNMEYEG